MKKSRPIEHQVCAQVGAAILKVGKMEGIKDFLCAKPTYGKVGNCVAGSGLCFRYER